MKDTVFPLFSIITPSKNRAHLLETAIHSVRVQNYSNIEYIIMDGGSTDNTVELVKKYPEIKIFSKADNGMYEALNRGLKKVDGQIIGFLNSDDYYADDVFNNISQLFNENQQLDAVIGYAEVFSVSPDQEIESSEIIQPLREEPLWNLMTGVPAFNAWFFRKEVFEKIGDFDTTLKFAADRDFLIRFYLKEMKYVFLDKTIYCYRSHSGSMTIDAEKRNELKIREEHLQIAEKCLELNVLSNEHQRDFHKWHTYNSVELARQFCEAREISSALRISRRGIAQNVLWPFAFVRRNLHVLINKIVGKE